MGAEHADWTADAFMAELFRVHSGPLLRYLLRLTLGDAARAEDLLQETMVRIWRHPEHFGGDVEALRPLVFTVARRAAIDAARARGARPAEVCEVDEAGSDTFGAEEPEFERVLLAQVVRRALLKLSPEHRAMIIEVHFNGRTIEETAHLLGIPLGTARSRTYHAARNLRQALTDLGFER
ncbi:RNA polymerase, sigma-24 subunit, ECF subfamily [Catenulispora acidiphila DSM 44928]|uniref:RNA polymerase, sigma-24 subunit, ECF subfamily n=1 Tax=Catenulispora acidiphila (strain DSM 44928 / JCM 14897 / NBRC 102108 / NRRL B-24433 / ID139908) TaxID=479433 RepID=C7Q7U1_CATAD|nr:sigma-70 family RNA polymerase sigma factor [Catenulispora acidiphila]ACU72284.1 RNA polymerase, sigma-24 subunit, ECF subfamily [Catenulispora acidiphila DSM 44928]